MIMMYKYGIEEMKEWRKGFERALEAPSTLGRTVHWLMTS
jgi:hypothetical protein